MVIEQTFSQKYDRFKRLIAASFWQYAASMPEDPHYYTLRRFFKQDDDFTFMVDFIREHGTIETFRGREYTYFYLDGWAYWTMGNPMDKTILINRCETEKPNSK